MATAPYDDRDGVIWMDGEFRPWRDSKVHVLTHALHYAGAVFEGQRAYGGRIFKLDEHTDRLFRSAEILGMDVPYSKDQINRACIETLEKSGFQDAYLRPIIWRGSEMMGVAAQANTIHAAVAVWEWPSYFSPEAKLKGLRLDIAPWRRPAPDTAPVHAKVSGLS